MDEKLNEISEKLFHLTYEHLGEREKWSDLISIQQEQLKLLSKLMEGQNKIK